MFAKIVLVALALLVVVAAKPQYYTGGYYGDYSGYASGYPGYYGYGSGYANPLSYNAYGGYPGGAYNYGYGYY
ncbi:hypothetical protein JYU34_021178 [Plutella xylostella]|uniref:Uncharacterized protein n=1 Tax=Plutella xylostella TaxID=51655 RepID=A0ABQ7PSY4_PLUXY|nr:hypothetical protein JYU34_021178 [Plutella xylostella]